MWVTAKTLLLALVLAALPLAAKEAASDDQDEPVAWQEKAVPGPAVTLRSKRHVGKCLIYEGTLARSQKAVNSYEEKDSFYLNVFCVDRKDDLDRVAIQRTYTDRKRTEYLENGKKVERILPNTTDLMNLGPNNEMVGDLRCYVLDKQNGTANRTEQLLLMNDGKQYQGKVLSEDDARVVFLTADDKLDLKRAEVMSIVPLPIPHVLLNETPHYFFPIFSQKKVSPGDTWKIKLTVIIPIEQGAPPRVLPTQFVATLIGRLREVREKDGNQTAVVDYRVRGNFDSSAAQFANRFPPGFQQANRIMHKFVLDGVATVDVDKGRLLSKSESLALTLSGSSLVSDGPDKPVKTQENKAEINAQFEIRLLPPGTRLNAQSVIPDYD